MSEIEIKLNKFDVEQFVGEENAERYMSELKRRLEDNGDSVDIEWTTGYDSYLIDGERDDDGYISTVMDKMGNTMSQWL